ncbi:MAG: M48 family metallopeptidase [Saprospiraceae bacterium]|nr:M48 family metallopeptidase [Saprospiraceae bacterium]
MATEGEGQLSFYDATYYQGVKPIARKVRYQIRNGFILIYDELQHQLLKEWDHHLILKHSYNENRLILKYGLKDPFEYLEITDPASIQILDQSFKKKKWLSTGGVSLEAYALIRIGILFSGIAAFMLILYFLLLPWWVGIASSWIPLEWEKKWADQMESGYADDPKVDSSATILMNSFYLSLAHKSPYDIRIFVLNDSIVNAFAMPGGILVIHRGMLNRINDYRQLVGLLGHEIAHVEKRHSLNSMAKSFGGMALFQFLFGGFDLFSGILAEQFRTIDQMSYSRDLEAEADREAVEFCIEHGVDPNGILGLFEILQKEEADQTVDIPGFLRSHPLTQDRISQTTQLIDSKSFRIAESTHPVLDSIFCSMKE